MTSDEVNEIVKLMFAIAGSIICIVIFAGVGIAGYFNWQGIRSLLKIMDSVDYGKDEGD